MTGISVILVMLASALAMFFSVLRLARDGQFGAVVTVLSVLGGAAMVLYYASGRPFGIDPVVALGLLLLGVFPALLGGGAGAILGRILRQRDDRRISGAGR